MNQSTCTVDGCDSPLSAKGMCKPHYSQDYYRRTLGAEIAARRSGEALLPKPTEKPCTRCSVVKNLEAFEVESRNQSTGRHAICRACRAEMYVEKRGTVLARVQKYYWANRELIAARKREDYARNVEAYRAKNVESHRRHRQSRLIAAAARRSRPGYADEARLRTSEWRRENPDRARESEASYRSRFPEKVAANQRRWQANNREKVRIHRLRRRDRQLKAGRIEFTSDQLASRVAFYGGRCWMCRGPFEHLDHVKPLSKGGITALCNLRPACRSCNLSKHDKWFGPTELHRFIR